jgi:hypothetical protein
MKTKIKKTLILLSALALPIFIFIFLRTFGKNEFNVEPLFQQAPLPVSPECGSTATAPYMLEEKKLTELRWSINDSLTLYVFNIVPFDETELTIRLAESQEGVGLQIHKITSDSTQLSEDKDPIVMSASAVGQLYTCFFLMQKVNAVLVDSKRRIRGHYNLVEREEIDRMLVEVKIISTANL